MIIAYRGLPYMDCTWIALVQWLASGTLTRMIQDRFPSDWLLHHGDSRGRHSANHNWLPDMHLCVPVLHVKRVVTVGLFKMSGRVTGKIVKSCETWKCDTSL